MMIRTWDLPIKAEWHRASELKSLSFSLDNKLTLLLLEEDSQKCWRLHFPQVQGFKWTTQESGMWGAVLKSLPATGAFYEVVDSPWLLELGHGVVHYMEHAKHYVICSYDEYVEVVATRYSIEEC